MILKDKVAVITGGARGIGKEIATLFASVGADIVLCDINEDLLNSAKTELQNYKKDVAIFKVDVTNSAEVDSMVEKTLDKFKKIDILINNAGIIRDGLLIRMKDADWDAVLNVNLKGTFNCTRAISRVMMKAHSGKIVNIASIIGIIGNAGQANYAASKGGIIAFTKSIAKELASRNINVNAIAPGFIKTDMSATLTPERQEAMLKLIPLSRFGVARDVANLALFLVSEESSYITGQAIQVDGGMVM